MLARLIDTDDVPPHQSSADVPSSPPLTPSRLPGPPRADGADGLGDLNKRYITVRNRRQAAWASERNQLLDLLDQQSHTMALMTCTHQQELDLVQAEVAELEHELRDAYAQLPLRRTEDASLPDPANDPTLAPDAYASNPVDRSLDSEEGCVDRGEGDGSPKRSQQGGEVERLRAQLVETQLLLRTERAERLLLQCQVDEARRPASHPPDLTLRDQKRQETPILSAYNKQVTSELRKVQAWYGRDPPPPDPPSAARSARTRSASFPLTNGTPPEKVDHQGKDATRTKTTSGSSRGSLSGSSDSLSSLSTVPARPVLKRLSLVSGTTTSSVASGLVRAHVGTRSTSPRQSRFGRRDAPLPPITTAGTAVRRPTAPTKRHVHYVSSDSGTG